jgi:hypothetical protein
MAKSDDRPTGKRGSKMSMAAATDKLTELANNPMARSMLAAGLVAAAAALTTNQKVRQSAKKAGQDALDGAGAAADNASKIGAAIVTAAAEAVRRLLPGDEAPAKGKSSTGRKSAAGKAKTAKGKAAKPAGRGRAKSAGAGNAAAKSAAKPASKPASKSAASRTKTASAASGRGANGAAAKTRGTKSAGGAKRGRKSTAKPADGAGGTT